MFSHAYIQFLKMWHWRQQNLCSRVDRSYEDMKSYHIWSNGEQREKEKTNKQTQTWIMKEKKTSFFLEI